MDSNNQLQNPDDDAQLIAEVEPCPGLSTFKVKSATRRSQNIPSSVSECHLTVDIILQTSDGKAISTHKANLGQFSNGFPPYTPPGAPDALMDEGQGLVERVTLEETADVLRLLLQFMHHTHLPELEDQPFTLVASMAEAAEKYQVYSAVALCKSFVKWVIS